MVNVFPFFTNPDAEFVVAKFYDVCTAVDFDALRWIEQNTPTEAVFVSQHGYGWWISGFGQRVTLSATDPQFLIVPHEFQAAKTAKNLLESSFILENGLIEVRDDGGYVGRYNPMLMIEADWSINSIPILYFNESEITVFYRHGDRLEIVDASQIPLKEEIVEKSENTVSISIVKENGYLTLNRRIEVFKGMKFILFTISIESQKESVSIEYVRIIVHGKGKLILNDGNVGILNEWAGLCGQLIFSYGYPNTRILSSESPNCLELIYSAADLHKMDIRMAAGGFKTENTDVTYVRRLLSNMTRLWTTIELDSNSSISLWDYRDAIKEWSTDYIVFKRQEYSIRKFLNNPMFKLVFINDNIAIFKVEERLQNNAP
ncbi:hypothetical protein H5T51_00260 [Candidatus Bathyarchaeota archaeon]|nr:hypothetical protein [Candidatus Bathyarchaeota archaeon]